MMVCEALAHMFETLFHKIFREAASVDTVFEGLQIIFDKLKAGFDAFGDNLQKSRNRSFVDQGASQCLIMNSLAF